MPRLPERPHRARRVLGLLVIAVSLALSPAAFLVAALSAAVIASAPAVFIGAGVLASFVVCYVLLTLALGLVGVSRRRPVAFGASGVVAVGLLAGFAAACLRPLVPEQDQFAARVPERVEFWSLATGSTVAVRSVPASGARDEAPVLFVHGGPGAYSVSMSPTVNTVSQLSADGHDVYFYDQVGGGLSGRLGDISEYTIERHISDLAAVIDRIGAPQVVLLGSSWGASLGASYMARNPGKVLAAVFSGAGPIFHPAWAGKGSGSLDERMTAAQRVAFSRVVETPRLLAALFLADVNPKAAVRFAGERELGALFDTVANRFYLPLAVCDSSRIDATSAGFGFWSNRMTNKSLQTRTDDPRPALSRLAVPVLVLRGECDYKREEVAREYASVFPNARYQTIQGAGHMLYWEKPDEYLERVRGFLDQVRDSD